MGSLHNITAPVAKATAAAPILTEGDVAGLSQDLTGALRVSASIGSVTASMDATATAAAPSYTEGTANPISQNLTGDQRVIAKIAASQTIGLAAGTAAIGTAGVTPAVTPALTRATVNITTATTTAIVGGTAAQTVRVYKILLNIAATQTLNIISSGGASLVGAAMSFAANGGLVLDFDGEPWFVTTSAEGLSFVTTTTGAVTGVVYYVKS